MALPAANEVSHATNLAAINPKPPDPASASETRLTFAALVAKPKSTSRFPELKIPSRQYGTKEGVPSISFSSSEYQAAAKRFDHTIIAKFQAGRPSLQEIRKFMIENWCLSGRCTITSCWDDRHLIIILDNEEDVRSALTHPQRKIGHAYFRLFRWEAGYNPKREIPKTTKWIRLPGLPIELFDRAIIRSIVSAFADFLDIDDRTKELSALSYARACVEFDVTQTLPNKVWINLPGDKGFFQDVIVEGGMNYCLKCRMHGHDSTSCKKGLKNQARTETKTDSPVRVSDYGPDNLQAVTKPSPTLPAEEWKMVTKRKAIRHSQVTGKNQGIILPSERVAQKLKAPGNGMNLPKGDDPNAKAKETRMVSANSIVGEIVKTKEVAPDVSNPTSPEIAKVQDIESSKLDNPDLDSSNLHNKEGLDTTQAPGSNLNENMVITQNQPQNNIKSSNWSSSFSMENCITCLTRAEDVSSKHNLCPTHDTASEPVDSSRPEDAHITTSAVTTPQGGPSNVLDCSVPHV